MARTSKPLEAKPPKRDPAIPDELWELPARVVRLGTKLYADQKALAKAAGVSQPTISKTLSYNNLKRFDARTAIKLARALETTVGFLIAGEGEVVPVRRSSSTPVPPSAVRSTQPPGH